MTRLRTQLNEFEESFNEKKKRFKFDIQLAEEREELAKIDGLDEVDVKDVNLDDIGVGKGKLTFG